MKKIFLTFTLVFGIFLLTGCSNDANNDEKEKILIALQNEKIIPANVEKVGSSSVEGTYFDATPTYKNLDVFEFNGTYYSINFDKKTLKVDNLAKNCNYIVEVYDDVTLLKNQEVKKSEYNSDTKEFNDYTVIEDVYKTNSKSVKKYCVNKVKKIFRKEYIELHLISNYE